MESTHRQQDASARMLYLRIFLAILVVMLLVGAAFALHLFMTGEVQAHSNQTTVAQEGHAQLLSPAQLNAAAAHQVAQQYMQALLAGQYNVMWSLLDAQAQAKWPDETSFATFWQAKFQDYRLQQYTLANRSGMPSGLILKR